MYTQVAFIFHILILYFMLRFNAWEDPEDYDEEDDIYPEWDDEFDEDEFD